MACRLVNCSAHALRIDLRGGTTLQLPPGATSPALLEELLYDNMFLRQWERDGLIARVPAKFADIAAAKPEAPARTGGKARSTAAPEKTVKKSKGKNAD